MSNPWLKKNPFMSMWLSWANQMAGAMRGQATSAVNKATKDNMKAMLGATAPKAKRRR